MNNILTPKMAWRFVTNFVCISSKQTEADALLKQLSRQVISVSRPSHESVGSWVPGPKRQSFEGVNVVGDLKIEFEDDTLNSVLEALEFLRTPGAVQELNILVSLLDGNGNALESYLYGRARLKTIMLSGLDYAAQGIASINGTIVTSAVEGELKLQGSISRPESTATTTLRRTVIFTPSWTQHYWKRQSGSALSHTDLLKEI